MTWTISIPYQSRDESVVDVAAHCRTLGQDEARVMRQLVISARIDHGVKTAGELLDHLEGLEPSARRALLDQARAECGLSSIEDVERQQRANAPLSLRSAPITPTTRLVRRENGSYAEEPIEPPRFARAPSGAIVDLDQQETEAARQRAREDSIRAQREAQAEERAPDAAAAREHQAARAEQLNRELPPHLREAI